MLRFIFWAIYLRVWRERIGLILSLIWEMTEVKDFFRLFIYFFYKYCIPHIVLRFNYITHLPLRVLTIYVVKFSFVFFLLYNQCQTPFYRSQMNIYFFY